MNGMLCRVVCVHLLFLFTTALVCPNEWQENTHHNSCVKLFTCKKTWFDAREKCTEYDSTLLHVETEKMYTFAVHMIGSLEFAWIATNDLAEEGVHRGTGGQLVTYLNWTHNQPNDGIQTPTHTQNGVVLKRNDMQDKKTSDQFYFVCEMWTHDIQTAKFAKMTEGFLESSNIGFDNNSHFRATTHRKYDCAMECRRQRPLCDAFGFNALAKDCYSLRLFDSDKAEVLTVQQRQEMSTRGDSVFLMIG